MIVDLPAAPHMLIMKPTWFEMGHTYIDPEDFTPKRQISVGGVKLRTSYGSMSLVSPDLIDKQSGYIVFSSKVVTR